MLPRRCSSVSVGTSHGRRDHPSAADRSAAPGSRTGGRQTPCPAKPCGACAPARIWRLWNIARRFVRRGGPVTGAGADESVLLARAFLSRVSEPASIPVWDWVRRHGPVACGQSPSKRVTSRRTWLSATRSATGHRFARTTTSPPPSDLASGLSCLRVQNGHTSRSHRSRLLPSPGLRPIGRESARTDLAAN